MRLGSLSPLCGLLPVRRYQHVRSPGHLIAATSFVNVLPQHGHHHNHHHQRRWGRFSKDFALLGQQQEEKMRNEHQQKPLSGNASARTTGPGGSRILLSHDNDPFDLLRFVVVHQCRFHDVIADLRGGRVVDKFKYKWLFPQPPILIRGGSWYDDDGRNASYSQSYRRHHARATVTLSQQQQPRRSLPQSPTDAAAHGIRGGANHHPISSSNARRRGFAVGFGVGERASDRNNRREWQAMGDGSANGGGEAVENMSRVNSTWALRDPPPNDLRGEQACAAYLTLPTVSVTVSGEENIRLRSAFSSASSEQEHGKEVKLTVKGGDGEDGESQATAGLDSPSSPPPPSPPSSSSSDVNLRANYLATIDALHHRFDRQPKASSQQLIGFPSIYQVEQSLLVFMHVAGRPDVDDKEVVAACKTLNHRLSVASGTNLSETGFF